MPIATRSKLKNTAIALIGLAIIGNVSIAIAGGPKHCPPGLAKKGTCAPPGLQKQWHKGDYLPANVQIHVVTNYDHYRLRRPQLGEVYLETGGRIYLVAEATKRVIEAVNLIEAATK